MPGDANSTCWCSQCNEFGDYKKTKEYLKFAPITIFSLERFTGKQKLQDSVVYPVRKLKLLDDTYDLFAVINHTGSSAKNAGHYSAHCLHENGQWYDFVDQKVAPIQDPVSANAYILFYKKQGLKLESKADFENVKRSVEPWFERFIKVEPEQGILKKK